MARQADRSAATIRLILDTARGLFATQGYDAVSIDTIAAAAGLA
jgi:AcrR family transcriptional regulator